MGGKRRKDKDVTPERVIREMAGIAFASFYDFCEVGEAEDGDGAARREVRLIPAENVPPEKRAALCSVRQSASGVEIKLCDKWKALDALAHILGMYEARGGEAQRAVTVIDDI